jgi:hypothetical protein
MKPKRLYLLSSLSLVILMLCAGLENAPAANWPQFRGPQASGIASEAAPIHWDVASGENVLWSTDIPGLAHASPIIWEDKIYLATAIRPGKKAELKVGLYGAGDSHMKGSAPMAVAVPDKSPADSLGQVGIRSGAATGATYQGDAL